MPGHGSSEANDVSTHSATAAATEPNRTGSATKKPGELSSVPLIKTIIGRIIIFGLPSIVSVPFIDVIVGCIIYGFPSIVAFRLARASVGILLNGAIRLCCAFLGILAAFTIRLGRFFDGAFLTLPTPAEWKQRSQEEKCQIAQQRIQAWARAEQSREVWKLRAQDAERRLAKQQQREDIRLQRMEDKRMRDEAVRCAAVRARR